MLLLGVQRRRLRQPLVHVTSDAIVSPDEADPDARVFCMGPVADERGASERSALGWALTGALGRPVSVRSMQSYDELVGGLVNADFAWLPPAAYVRARAKHDLHLLGALRRQNSKTYHGVLFVKRESKRKKLDDLTGARVAWVEPGSASGHLFPRLLLRESGFSTESLADQCYLGTHESVVDAVASGLCDVGATYASFDDSGELVRAGWTRRHDDAVRVLAVSRPIPADVLCATERGTSLATRLTLTLRAMGGHRSGEGLLGSIFGATELVDAQPAGYDVVRDALASVLEL